MSATLDAKLFCSFFHGAPLVSVPGRTFPVSTYYLEDLIDATNHIIEEGSRYAHRGNGSRETASMWITTRGGEKRKEMVSLESELDTEVSDDFIGYKMATRR
jgi:HrpA-like RNA helicase